MYQHAHVGMNLVPWLIVLHVVEVAMGMLAVNVVGPPEVTLSLFMELKGYTNSIW